MAKFLRGSYLRGVSVIALAVAGCGPQRIEPFNPHQLQHDERALSQHVPMLPIRPLPTTLESPVEDESGAATTGASTHRSKYPPATGPAIGSTEPTVRIPLREIIHRAVANNLDVKVAGYQPAIDETRVTEAEARFDPTFFSNVQYSDQTTLAPNENNLNITAGQPITFQSWSSQIGVRQDLQSGGRVELRYEPAVTHRSIAGTPELVDPFYTSNLTLQLTQPLLRDFGAGVNAARITIARNNQRISVMDFREQLEKTLSDLEKSYWQLVEAMGEVRIDEDLLKRTVDTADLLNKRKGNDVTRVQISQASSAVERRRVILIRARSRVRDLSDQIKQLMNDPEYPVSGPTLILPADTPLQDQIQFNREDQIATGLENRLELGQQQLRVDSAGIAALVAKNNLLPQLNLVGSVGVQGLDDTFGSSVSSQFGDEGQVSYSIGLQLEIPIGNRAARAIWRRAQLQREQAIVQYRSVIEKIAFDVDTAIREVEVTWLEMVGTRQGRFAAYDALDAIFQREAANEALTPEFVNRKLNLQEEYAQAQQLEVQAIANYNIALSRLEQSKGTLLRYNNVLMEEAPRAQR
jgi:outer membrane protein TolC